MCGIDNTTYKTTYDAIDKGSCYLLCGVTALYEGECGCPNSCQSQFGHGECSSGVCACKEGWGGDDCSLPVKGNKCSYHGKLISTSDSDSEMPFDYCDCDSGFTGVDCSTDKLEIENAPWGTIFDDVEAYSSKDEYGDDHPLFNIQRIATIRIEMKEEDLVTLITPSNLYDNEYYSADFYWDNGKTRHSFKNVGVKLKGQASREYQKKGFSVKFNEFVSDQRIFDMKKIGLKPSDVSDDCFLKNVLYNNFIRAVGGPVQRTSYALLYFNHRFYGVMIVVEDYDDEFITRRLEGDDGQGSFMKLCYRVHLGYYGDNVTYYQERTHSTKTGGELNYYSPQSDNADLWTDFISLLYYFNITSGTQLEETVNTYININQLLRQMAVESFVMAGDHFQHGNNYFLYHQQAKKDYSKQWLTIYTDFDELLQFDPSDSAGDPDVPEENPDIITVWSNDINDYDRWNPLVDQIFKSNTLTKQYLSNFQIFVEKIFGSDSKEQPSDRVNRLFGLIGSWVEKDRMWRISNGMTYEDFVLLAGKTLDHLTWRYQDVQTQLSDYSSKV